MKPSTWRLHLLLQFVSIACIIATANATLVNWCGSSYTTYSNNFCLSTNAYVNTISNSNPTFSIDVNGVTWAMFQASSSGTTSLSGLCAYNAIGSFNPTSITQICIKLNWNGNGGSSLYTSSSFQVNFHTVAPISPVPISAVASAPTVTTASCSAASISWPSVSGATGYYIYRDSVLIAAVFGASYDDVVWPGTYTYTISAFSNTEGETAQSLSTTQLIGTSPGTPGSFAVANPTNSLTMTVTWSSSSGDVTYYSIRSHDSGYNASAWTEHGVVLPPAPNTLVFQETAPSCNYYYMFACQTGGGMQCCSSSTGAWRTVYDPGFAPDPVTDIPIYNITACQIATLTFNASDNADIYNFYSDSNTLLGSFTTVSNDTLQRSFSQAAGTTVAIVVYAKNYCNNVSPPSPLSNYVTMPFFPSTPSMNWTFNPALPTTNVVSYSRPSGTYNYQLTRTNQVTNAVGTLGNYNGTSWSDTPPSMGCYVYKSKTCTQYCCVNEGSIRVDMGIVLARPSSPAIQWTGCLSASFTPVLPAYATSMYFYNGASYVGSYTTAVTRTFTPLNTYNYSWVATWPCGTSQFSLPTLFSTAGLISFTGGGFPAISLVRLNFTAQESTGNPNYYNITKSYTGVVNATVVSSATFASVCYMTGNNGLTHYCSITDVSPPGMTVKYTITMGNSICGLGYQSASITLTLPTFTLTSVTPTLGPYTLPTVITATSSASFQGMPLPLSCWYRVNGAANTTYGYMSAATASTLNPYQASCTVPAGIVPEYSKLDLMLSVSIGNATFTNSFYMFGRVNLTSCSPSYFSWTNSIPSIVCVAPASLPTIMNVPTLRCEFRGPGGPIYPMQTVATYINATALSCPLPPFAPISSSSLLNSYTNYPNSVASSSPLSLAAWVQASNNPTVVGLTFLPTTDRAAILSIYPSPLIRGLVSGSRMSGDSYQLSILVPFRPPTNNLTLLFDSSSSTRVSVRSKSITFPVISPQMTNESFVLQQTTVADFDAIASVPYNLAMSFTGADISYFCLSANTSISIQGSLLAPVDASIPLLSSLGSLSIANFFPLPYNGYGGISLVFRNGSSSHFALDVSSTPSTTFSNYNTWQASDTGYPIVQHVINSTDILFVPSQVNAHMFARDVGLRIQLPTGLVMLSVTGTLSQASSCGVSSDGQVVSGYFGSKQNDTSLWSTPIFSSALPGGAANVSVLLNEVFSVPSTAKYLFLMVSANGNDICDAVAFKNISVAVPQMALTSSSPAQGPSANAAVITLIGLRLFSAPPDYCYYRSPAANSSVTTGFVFASNATFLSASTALCQLPASTEYMTVDVRLDNALSSATLYKAFYYYGRTSVFNCTPPILSFGSTISSISCAGSDFANAASLQCRFNSSSYASPIVTSATFISSTVVLCALPSLPFVSINTSSLPLSVEITNNATALGWYPSGCLQTASISIYHAPYLRGLSGNSGSLLVGESYQVIFTLPFLPPSSPLSLILNPNSPSTVAVSSARPSTLVFNPTDVSLSQLFLIDFLASAASGSNFSFTFYLNGTDVPFYGSLAAMQFSAYGYLTDAPRLYLPSNANPILLSSLFGSNANTANGNNGLTFLFQDLDTFTSSRNSPVALYSSLNTTASASSSLLSFYQSSFASTASLRFESLDSNFPFITVSNASDILSFPSEISPHFFSRDSIIRIRLEPGIPFIRLRGSAFRGITACNGPDFIDFMVYNSPPVGLSATPFWTYIGPNLRSFFSSFDLTIPIPSASSSNPFIYLVTSARSDSSCASATWGSVLISTPPLPSISWTNLLNATAIYGVPYTLTITGTGFLDTNRIVCRFGGIDVVNATFVNNTAITCPLPTNLTAPLSFSFANPSTAPLALDISNNPLYYSFGNVSTIQLLQLNISTISPSQGPNTLSNTITITAPFLDPALSATSFCYIRSAAAASSAFLLASPVTYLNRTHASCSIPPSSTYPASLTEYSSLDVMLSVSPGINASLSNVFQYYGRVNFSSCSPNQFSYTTGVQSILCIDANNNSIRNISSLQCRFYSSSFNPVITSALYVNSSAVYCALPATLPTINSTFSSSFSTNPMVSPNASLLVQANNNPSVFSWAVNRPTSVTVFPAPALRGLSNRAAPRVGSDSYLMTAILPFSPPSGPLALQLHPNVSLSSRVSTRTASAIFPPSGTTVTQQSLLLDLDSQAGAYSAVFWLNGQDSDLYMSSTYATYLLSAAGAILSPLQEPAAPIPSSSAVPPLTLNSSIISSSASALNGITIMMRNSSSPFGAEHIALDRYGTSIWRSSDTGFLSLELISNGNSTDVVLTPSACFSSSEMRDIVIRLRLPSPVYYLQLTGYITQYGACSASDGQVVRAYFGTTGNSSSQWTSPIWTQTLPGGSNSLNASVSINTLFQVPSNATHLFLAVSPIGTDTCDSLLFKNVSIGPPVMVLTSVSPSYIPYSSASSLLTLFGTGFYSTASDMCYIRSASGLPLSTGFSFTSPATIVSSTMALCTIPSGSEYSTVDIRLDSSTSSAGLFSSVYLYGRTSVASCSPSAISWTSTLAAITCTGSNFINISSLQCRFLNSSLLALQTTAAVYINSSTVLCPLPSSLPFVSSNASSPPTLQVEISNNASALAWFPTGCSLRAPLRIYPSPFLRGLQGPRFAGEAYQLQFKLPFSPSTAPISFVFNTSTHAMPRKSLVTFWPNETSITSRVIIVDLSSLSTSIVAGSNFSLSFYLTGNSNDLPLYGDSPSVPQLSTGGYLIDAPYLALAPDNSQAVFLSSLFSTNFLLYQYQDSSDGSVGANQTVMLEQNEFNLNRFSPFDLQYPLVELLSPSRILARPSHVTPHLVTRRAVMRVLLQPGIPFIRINGTQVRTDTLCISLDMSMTFSLFTTVPSSAATPFTSVTCPPNTVALFENFNALVPIPTTNQKSMLYLVTAAGTNSECASAGWDNVFISSPPAANALSTNISNPLIYGISYPVLVIGNNFLRTGNVTCKYNDDSGAPLFAKATYISSTSVACIIPSSLNLTFTSSLYSNLTISVSNHPVFYSFGSSTSVRFIQLNVTSVSATEGPYVSSTVVTLSSPSFDTSLRGTCYTRVSASAAPFEFASIASYMNRTHALCAIPPGPEYASIDILFSVSASINSTLMNAFSYYGRTNLTHCTPSLLSISSPLTSVTCFGTGMQNRATLRCVFTSTSASSTAGSVITTAALYLNSSSIQCALPSPLLSASSPSLALTPSYASHYWTQPDEQVPSYPLDTLFIQANNNPALIPNSTCAVATSACAFLMIFPQPIIRGLPSTDSSMRAAGDSYLLTVLLPFAPPSANLSLDFSSSIPGVSYRARPRSARTSSTVSTFAFNVSQSQQQQVVQMSSFLMELDPIPGSTAFSGSRYRVVLDLVGTDAALYLAPIIDVFTVPTLSTTGILLSHFAAPIGGTSFTALTAPFSLLSAFPLAFSGSNGTAIMYRQRDAASAEERDLHVAIDPSVSSSRPEDSGFPYFQAISVPSTQQKALRIAMASPSSSPSISLSASRSAVIRIALPADLYYLRVNGSLLAEVVPSALGCPALDLLIFTLSAYTDIRSNASDGWTSPAWTVSFSPTASSIITPFDEVAIIPPLHKFLFLSLSVNETALSNSTIAACYDSISTTLSGASIGLPPQAVVTGTNITSFILSGSSAPVLIYGSGFFRSFNTITNTINGVCRFASSIFVPVTAVLSSSTAVCILPASLPGLQFFNDPAGLLAAVSIEFNPDPQRMQWTSITSSAVSVTLYTCPQAISSALYCPPSVSNPPVLSHGSTMACNLTCNFDQFPTECNISHIAARTSFNHFYASNPAVYPDDSIDPLTLLPDAITLSPLPPTPGVCFWSLPVIFSAPQGGSLNQSHFELYNALYGLPLQSKDVVLSPLPASALFSTVQCNYVNGTFLSNGAVISCLVSCRNALNQPTPCVSSEFLLESLPTQSSPPAIAQTPQYRKQASFSFTVSIPANGMPSSVVSISASLRPSANAAIGSLPVLLHTAGAAAAGNTNPLNVFITQPCDISSVVSCSPTDFLSSTSLVSANCSITCFSNGRQTLCSASDFVATSRFGSWSTPVSHPAITGPFPPPSNSSWGLLITFRPDFTASAANASTSSEPLLRIAILDRSSGSSYDISGSPQVMRLIPPDVLVPQEDPFWKAFKELAFMGPAIPLHYRWIVLGSSIFVFLLLVVLLIWYLRKKRNINKKRAAFKAALDSVDEVYMERKLERRRQKEAKEAKDLMSKRTETMRSFFSRNNNNRVVSIDEEDDDSMKSIVPSSAADSLMTMPTSGLSESFKNRLKKKVFLPDPHRLESDDEIESASETPDAEEGSEQKTKETRRERDTPRKVDEEVDEEGNESNTKEEVLEIEKLMERQVVDQQQQQQEQAVGPNVVESLDEQVYDVPDFVDNGNAQVARSEDTVDLDDDDVANNVQEGDEAEHEEERNDAAGDLEDRGEDRSSPHDEEEEDEEDQQEEFDEEEEQEDDDEEEEEEEEVQPPPRPSQNDPVIQRLFEIANRRRLEALPQPQENEKRVTFSFDSRSNQNEEQPAVRKPTAPQTPPSTYRRSTTGPIFTIH